MKNKGVYVGIIISLFVIIIALVGYIIYSNKDDNNVVNNCQPCNKNDNKTINEEENDETNKKEKIVSIELKDNKKISVDETYNEEETVIYNIKVNNYTLKVYYNKDYTYFETANDINSFYTGSNNILYTLQKYNNYVFVTMACQCGITPVVYVVDLEKDVVLNEICLPSSNGTCSGYIYNQILTGQYYEQKYNINYNTGSSSLVKSDKFSCSDYSKYAPINDDGSRVIKCENNTCERRVEFCYPYGD